MATLTPSSELTTAYDQTLELATASATVQVRRRLQTLTIETFTAAYPAAARRIATTIRNSQESAVTASAWYLAEAVRTTTAFPVTVDPVSDLVGTTGAGMSVERYLARTPEIINVRVANGMEAEAALAMSQRAIIGFATSEAFRVARTAVAQTTIGSQAFVGWQRVPEAGACAFCRSLASRGGVYKSRETAQLTSKALSYHKRCRCRAVPVTSQESAAAQIYADAQSPIFYRTGARSGGRRAAAGTSNARPASLTDFYRQAPLYRAGARTPERLASVQLQINQIEDRISDLTARSRAGDVSTEPALTWSAARLRELQSELSALT